MITVHDEPEVLDVGAAVPTRGVRSHGTWPVAAFTIAMPVAYLLGLGAFVWIAPVLIGAALLVRRPSVRWPWFVLPLVALILWIPVTALSLHGPGSFALFGYRWLLWVATAAGALWLCNTPTRTLPTSRIVDRLADLWIVLVGFGYIALLFPNVAVASPLGRLLPTSLATNRFVYDLTVIRFAELQRFVGGTVPRPAAPMAATNGWGSTLVILTPFFILSWLLAGDRRRRRAGWLLAAAAVPPFAFSANRGALLTLALGLAYVAARRAYRGDARPLVVVVVGSALTVVILVLTPLGGVVATRLTGAGASDSTRESLYGQAWDRTTRSPLIGYGEPVANDPDPPIGTHGLVWYAMVAHGIPGLLLLLAALVALLVASARARTQTALWAHAAILIGVIQAPVYGLLPQIVVLGLAAGICWREDHPELAARG